MHHRVSEREVWKVRGRCGKREGGVESEREVRKVEREVRKVRGR